MNDIVIEVKNISKTYGSGEVAFEALKDVSFSVNRGSFVSLMGRSGSGKSTLLHIMASLDKCTSGEVILDGVNINSLSNKERCSLRNEKIGFIFQSFYLEENYTVFTNIEMPLIISGIPKKERIQMVNDVAEKVGLSSKLKNKAANLSGGEKQRVAIARAIVNKPLIIFADEPCGNLDTENSDIIMNLLADLTKMNVTVVLVTHSLDDVQKTERIISLRDGMVISDEMV
ncbi:MAG: ABC transporter ATP-binding protein [Acutalibacteraceae bacterium]|nr:ABC transporter ATP-binding protein [Acutalibacteraceae bacterium]